MGVDGGYNGADGGKSFSFGGRLFSSDRQLFLVSSEPSLSLCSSVGLGDARINDGVFRDSKD
jgi:hypothetical protein